jgi:uncharacterized damage-inducible protein DinB
MIPQLQRRFDELEEERLDFLSRMKGLSEEQLLFRPVAGHWNLAQITQHLMLVEQSFLSHIGEEKYRSRKPRFHPLIGKALVWVYFKMELKVKVPVKKAIPDDIMPLDRSTALWEEKRAALRNYFESFDQDRSRQKIFFHPYMGGLDSAEFLSFMKRHFDHHMKQAERIKRAPHFPK